MPIIDRPVALALATEQALLQIPDPGARRLQLAEQNRLTLLGALAGLPQLLLVDVLNAQRALRRAPMLHLPVVHRTDQRDVLLLNGMDAPFLNRHRGAKVEVLVNHF